ncbi:hypothetical protein VTN96DRAFT_1900 [Rasamsonia emersonii]
MVVRVLLGVCEACVAPSLVLITGMWWTKPEQSRRTGLWYMQIGMAQIVGASVSYGFQQVHSDRLANWQILFLFMVRLLHSPSRHHHHPPPPRQPHDSPVSHRAGAHRRHRARVRQPDRHREQAVQAVPGLLFRDKETWPLFFITLLAMIDNGAVSNFSSIIIASFGFSTGRTTIVQMPSGAVSIVATFAATYLVGAIGHRSYIIALITLPSILGWLPPFFFFLPPLSFLLF